VAGRGGKLKPRASACSCCLGFPGTALVPWLPDLEVSWLPQKEIPPAETLSADSVSGANRLAISRQCEAGRQELASADQHHPYIFIFDLYL
jgi:hypothetical protein